MLNAHQFNESTIDEFMPDNNNMLELIKIYEDIIRDNLYRMRPMGAGAVKLTDELRTKMGLTSPNPLKLT